MDNEAALWALQQSTAVGLPIARHSNTEAMLASLAPGMQVDGSTIDNFIRESARTLQAGRVQSRDSAFFASVLNAPRAAALYAAHPPPPPGQKLMFPVGFTSGQQTHWMLVFVMDSYVMLYDAGLKRHEEQRQSVFEATRRYMAHHRPRVPFTRVDVRLPATRGTLADSGVWALAAADWLFAGRPLEPLDFGDLTALSARIQLARNLVRMTNGRWDAYAQLEANGDLKPAQAPPPPPPQDSSQVRRLRKIKREVAEGVVECRKQPKFACTSCPRRFRKQILLAQHLRTHTSLKFRCSFCQAHAKSFRNRNAHERSAHKLKRPHEFMCAEGPLPEKIREKLKHTIKHSFKCECGIVLDSRNKLKVHICEFHNAHLLPERRRAAQASEPEQLSPQHVERQVEQPVEPQQQREPSEALPSVGASPPSTTNARDPQSPLSEFNSPLPSGFDRSRGRSMSVLPNAANGPLISMLKPTNRATERVETMNSSEIMVYDYDLTKTQYGWTPIEFWLESTHAELLVLRLAAPQWEEAELPLPPAFLSVPHQRYELPRGAARMCNLVFFVKAEVAHKYASLKGRMEADPSISLQDLVVCGIRELPIRRAVVIVTERMRQRIREKAAEAVGIL